MFCPRLQAPCRAHGLIQTACIDGARPLRGNPIGSNLTTRPRSAAPGGRAVSVGPFLAARSRAGWQVKPGGPVEDRRVREDPVDRAEKKELVGTLNAVFKAANVVVVAHYSGLTVAQMQTLRRQMKQAGATVKVAKNRLAQIAPHGPGGASIR